MNQAMERFAYNPVQLEIPRSKQTMKHSHSTTYDTGMLVPIYWREVLPGSTCKMQMAEVTRMQTPLFPIMGNAYVDTFFFFVPNRILWAHWEEFMGENKSGYWEQKHEYEVPQIVFNSNNTIVTTGAPYWIKGDDYYPYGVQTGSLADYLGIPVVDANTTTPTWRGEFEANALPFRAYYEVYNTWFRDENLMNPLEYDKGDSDVTAYMGSADPEAMWCLVPPPQVAKFHDCYTSALPQPQKHDDVLLPLGNVAPVTFGDSYIETLPTNTDLKGSQVGAYAASGYAGSMYAWDENESGIAFDSTKSNGLVVDLSAATGATINELRNAFAVQRYYEKLARGGWAAA